MMDALRDTQMIIVIFYIVTNDYSDSKQTRRLKHRMILHIPNDHNGTLKWVDKNIEFSHHNIANLFSCILCLLVISHKILVMVICVVELRLMYKLIIRV
jgi:hypothetical protein